MAEQLDSDSELMLRFQAGEEACFEELVERHKQRVFRTAYRFLGVRQDAEDIAQEVFLRVYRARDTYEPRARFTTWLYAICRNTCFKRLRKQSGSPVSLSDEVELEDGSAPRQLADARAPSPLESALRDERAALVKQAIEALPTSQRMALVLCKYEGLSYAEIAEAIGRSEKAVKSLLHRARQNLKEMLAGYFEKS